MTSLIFFSADGSVVSDSAIWMDGGFVRSTDISFAITRRPSHKSCGVDGIPNIALNSASEVVFTFLSILFNHCIIMVYFPSVWKEAMLVPILRRGSDPNICGSCRPISLLSAFGKLPEFFILDRIRKMQRRGTSLGTANLALRGDIPAHTP